jgi:D-3-phosphoglycerate dehydrogenase
VIEAGKGLRIIGRAGVGVDNIDLDAATRAGIVVENTPTGNITSAAEHAVGLLFACARRIARADRDMKAGKWSKKECTGVELSGKTLGLVGMGKVGSIVARVAGSLDMELLVHDPYVTEQRAAELGAVKTDLDDLLARSDFVSLHVPATAETVNLIDRDRLQRMKRTAYLVNAARGGIVNEGDLAAALAQGVIAGAALDVFAEEPLDATSPLRSLDNAILTPHLGASTAEAQTRVATDIARQVVEFLQDGAIRHAVNVEVRINPRIAPYAELADILGQMAAQMVAQPVQKMEVSCFGQLAREETRELGLAALKGLLRRTTGEPVTLVNAPLIAAQRGVELAENKSVRSPTYANLLSVAVSTADARHVLAGTCFDGQEARIVRIDEFLIDVKPAEVLLVMLYPDRPGMVGKFGTILGEAGINIANMAVGRREKRGRAAVVLTLDDPVPPEVIRRIKEAASIERLHAITVAL